jgi:hypothetical protein
VRVGVIQNRNMTQNINSGKGWSEMDLQDIRDFAALMTPTELADYLCRSEREVVAKVEELGLEFNT